MTALHELDGRVLSGLQEAFRSKIAEEIIRGNEAFAAGTIEPFRGYDPDRLGKGVLVIAELNQESADEIHRRVSGPLRNLAEEYGIQLAIPDDGLFPPHITVQQILMPEQDTQQFINDAVPPLAEQVWCLQGAVIKLDTLVLSGQRAIVCVSNPTPAVSGILRARDGISGIAGRLGGVLKTDPCIIHTSVGRISEVTNPTELPALARSTYHQIGQPLCKEPIEARIKGVFVGSGLDYARKTGIPFNRSRRRE